MQENSMYIIYTPSSTEHDFEEMWNKQEAFAEAELGDTTYWAIRQELEDE